LPDEDFDGDGISNIQEWLDGTDPTTSIRAAITLPSETPSFTDSSTVTVAGTANADVAERVELTVNGGATISITLTDDPWQADSVPLSAGPNIIVATAIDDGGTNPSATTSITIVRDTQNPVVTIIDPVYEGDYPTASTTISISGLASDDTGVASVTWLRTATGSPDAEGAAAGTDNWNCSDIPLVEDTLNTVTITALDDFGGMGSAVITVLQEPGVEVQVEVDLTDEGLQPEGDPLDLDGDDYLNEDESACLGENPTAPNDPDVYPSNYGFEATGTATLYPTNPADPHYNANKVGYKWPDCLNPDDDGDGLPDWWENQYFGSDTAADPAADVEVDENGDPAEDGFTNAEEYQNGTDPLVPQYTMFVLNLYDEADQLITSTYLPEYGKTVKIRATWQGSSSSAPATVSYRLVETSSYPGRAINDPDPAIFSSIQYPAGYDYNGPDFGLALSELAAGVHVYDQGPLPVSKAGEGTYTIYLQCLDYGGRTKVLVTDPSAPEKLDAMWVPAGAGSNGIAMAWDYDGDPGTTNPQSPNALDPNADIDTIIFDTPGIYTAPQGDDLNTFEEFRGYVYYPVEEMIKPPQDRVLKHQRLNPHHKDLFVRAVGYDDAYGNPYDAPPEAAEDPFWLGRAFENAGIDIHNITGWGHDATVDSSFFIYHTAGTIACVTDYTITGNNTGWQPSWPLYEWEFKLDVDFGDEASNPADNRWMPVVSWDVNTLVLMLPYKEGTVNLGDGAYKIRMPLPRINALIIRHDRTLKGVFSNEQGYIRFIAATPPGALNPSGSRHWAWSTKGLGISNALEGNHGIALTLKAPLDHYFADDPYQKGKVWDPVSGEWKTAQGSEVNYLEPLSRVEDRADQLIPIDGIMPGDSPNGAWDGDRRLETFTGTLSPFDINGNGLVELPFGFDPTAVDANTEYSKAQALRHTITHEIGHAIGVPSHSDAPLCLMYKYSSNWNRQDYLSDWFRSVLEVSNEMRY